MDRNGHSSGETPAETGEVASGKVWRQDTVTSTVQVLDILPDYIPPRILTGQHLTRNGKPGRLFQQMVPVPDAALFARLTSQVSRGDTIQITVTTVWHEDGYTTALDDFDLPSAITAHIVENIAA